jgi:hypothetical protein
MALTPFLSKWDIPIYAKCMVIKGVLFPICCYGGEIVGMSTARVEPLQRIIDKACRLVVRCGRTVCKTRLRNELGIMTVAKATALARARGYCKWADSRTWIALLIACPPRLRTSTWVTGTARWIKRFAKIEPVALHEGEKRRRLNRRALVPGVSIIANTTESIREEILSIFNTREERGDRSLYTEMCRSIGIVHSTEWIRLGLLDPSLGRGVLALGQLRIDCFMTGTALAQRRVLPAKYFSECPVCLLHTREDVGHILLRCSKWDNERRQFLGPLLEGIEITHAALPRVVGGLLGGELRGEDCQGPLAKFTSRERQSSTAKYLDAIVGPRLSLVRSRTGKLLNRTLRNQGHLGRIALDEQ